MMRGVLATIGDLVEDVIVWLDESVRAAADTPCRVFRRRGGSAANVAAYAATTGAPVRFCGQVGDDDAGAILTAALAAAGVEVRVRRRGRTGTVVVLVSPDGERSMLPDRATAVDLADVPETWLAGVEVLHVPAYSLAVEPLATAARRAAACVRDRGGALTIDASSTTVIDALGATHVRALLADLAPTVLFTNADEAAALGIEQPLDGVGLTVVKRGAAPVRLVPASGAVVEVPVPALTTGRPRDTTGAGDAFAAGFLAAWMAGATPAEAAAAGNRLAATTLGQPGASMVTSGATGP